MIEADDGADRLRHFRVGTFSSGELARVRQLLDDHGKALLLPYDQFVEHDSRHFEAESDSGNPRWALELAVGGPFTGVVLHAGLAQRYWSACEGAVPLILKLNGRSGVPPNDDAFSPYTARVEDAVRMGAAAVAYTLSWASTRQEDDLRQLADARRECERYGMPLLVRARSAGRCIEERGGGFTNYAIESAVRMAVEMGATMVAASVPRTDVAGLEDSPLIPEYYRALEAELRPVSHGESLQIRCDRVVRAGQGVPVVFCGGDLVSDEDLLYRAELCVKAGCTGFLFGRNIWKRERSRAYDMSGRLRSLLREAD